MIAIDRRAVDESTGITRATSAWGERSPGSAILTASRTLDLRRAAHHAHRRVLEHCTPGRTYYRPMASVEFLALLRTRQYDVAKGSEDWEGEKEAAAAAVAGRGKED
jgi:hypothetical protein